MSQHGNDAAVPSSVPGMCLEALERHAKADALSLKKSGQWLHIPGEAIIRRVRAVALGLSALGVRKGDRVALLSENRPDWSVVDLAILGLGAVNVPIYTTQAPEQVRFILEGPGARGRADSVRVGAAGRGTRPRRARSLRPRARLGRRRRPGDDHLHLRDDGRAPRRDA